MEWKKILIRGLILALILVGIALVGGIATLDIPIILIIFLLVLILATLTVILHNQRANQNKEDD